MQDTLNIAISNAERNQACQIIKITMNIGKLSGVVPEALEFAFDIVTKNTIAENATLKINNIPIICYCNYCHSNFSPAEWFFECPNCQQFTNNIIQGKEMELVSVEIITK
jgi:hydrogenase nickel incorporation protein HypA/HybF